ncbi:hypothetical protein A374_06896 [Fictibacillus macauensis ZFHKF-1]|uniref:Uncharacterized protein n=1 Tax=Fictibacillus macauensis ZFHKF-1 TaxID=1196324 RepID=I8AJR7_9BACL|nr:hypothetical protein A374_06896 [Fictibacillus macauensis ZFHKF-1]
MILGHNQNAPHGSKLPCGAFFVKCKMICKMIAVKASYADCSCSFKDLNFKMYGRRTAKMINTTRVHVKYVWRKDSEIVVKLRTYMLEKTIKAIISADSILDDDVTLCLHPQVVHVNCRQTLDAFITSPHVNGCWQFTHFCIFKEMTPFF